MALSLETWIRRAALAPQAAEFCNLEPQVSPPLGHGHPDFATCTRSFADLCSHCLASESRLRRIIALTGVLILLATLHLTIGMMF